jgi:aryl-alcohol dehydrogenase-like predicted oxidoreductase
MVSKLILGTVQFGLDYGINNNTGKVDSAEVKSILDIAFQSNIMLLDTAEAYGNAQEVIGQYHTGSKHKFNIITKFSSSRKDLPFELNKRIDYDLKALNVEKLYCYMFHSYQDFKAYYPQYEKEIGRLKAKSVIARIGVSLYSNEELEDLLNYDIDLIQLPFNLLDNKQHRFSAINKAKQKGIEVHTRSAFLQGLFFKDIKSLPPRLKDLESHLLQINRIASSHNLDMNDLALGYTIQQDYIDRVLIGVDSAAQLQQNMQSTQKRITDDVVEEIDQIKVEHIHLLNPSNWKN